MHTREERMWDGMLKIHLHGDGWVVHEFTLPDLGDPHDHPFRCVSRIIRGGYTEEIYGPEGLVETVERRPGDEFEIPHDRIHRIVHMPEGFCITAYKPMGPKVQEPGFYRWRDGVMLSRRWFEDEFSPHAL